MTGIGARLAHAIAAKDEAALRAVLAADVDFRGLTPGRTWEGTGPDDGRGDGVRLVVRARRRDRAVVDVAERDDVADTSHVGYRFDLANADGAYVAEQQVYYRGDGVIEHLRVMCSGFRPR